MLRILTEGIGLAGDGLDESGQGSNEVARVGNVALDGGTSGTVDDLANTKVGDDDLVDLLDGILNLGDAASTVVDSRGGESRHGQSGDSDENSLHCEFWEDN